jgi:hypothetical protein
VIDGDAERMVEWKRLWRIYSTGTHLIRNVNRDAAIAAITRIKPLLRHSPARSSSNASPARYAGCNTQLYCTGGRRARAVAEGPVITPFAKGKNALGHAEPVGCLIGRPDGDNSLSVAADITRCQCSVKSSFRSCLALPTIDEQSLMCKPSNPPRHQTKKPARL